MSLGALDILVFVAFVVSVVSIGSAQEPQEKTGEDYFLAGRGLSWWLIGFSLIAANISTEQFVGMSGQAARLARHGHRQLRVDGRHHTGRRRLCVPALVPQGGIYTIPEFLEYRYNALPGRSWRSAP